MSAHEGQRFGRYEFAENLSASGHSEVFKAKLNGADGFEKIVALKKLSGESTAEQVSIFVEKAKLAANLTHVNIPQVIEFGQAEGVYFVAMEYVHGKNLDEICAHFNKLKRSMPIPFAVHVVLSVCQALVYAHRKKVFHGNLLPENILISYEGAVKLVDFYGKPPKERHAESVWWQVAAPELRDNPTVPLDERSEIFSIAALLYFCITRHYPYAQAATSSAQELKSPSRINPLVPRKLDEIVGKALARDPAHRFQKAEELLAELERFSQSARLSFNAQQLSRWMKTNFTPDQKSSVAELPSPPSKSVETSTPKESVPQAQRLPQGTYAFRGDPTKQPLVESINPTAPSPSSPSAARNKTLLGIGKVNAPLSRLIEEEEDEDDAQDEAVQEFAKEESTERVDLPLFEKMAQPTAASSTPVTQPARPNEADTIVPPSRSHDARAKEISLETGPFDGLSSLDVNEPDESTLVDPMGSAALLMHQAPAARVDEAPTGSLYPHAAKSSEESLAIESTIEPTRDEPTKELPGSKSSSIEEEPAARLEVSGLWGAASIAKGHEDVITVSRSISNLSELSRQEEEPTATGTLSAETKPGKALSGLMTLPPDERKSNRERESDTGVAADPVQFSMEPATVDRFQDDDPTGETDLFRNPTRPGDSQVSTLIQSEQIEASRVVPLAALMASQTQPVSQPTSTRTDIHQFQTAVHPQGASRDRHFAHRGQIAWIGGAIVALIAVVVFVFSISQDDEPISGTTAPSAAMTPNADARIVSRSEETASETAPRDASPVDAHVVSQPDATKTVAPDMRIAAAKPEEALAKSTVENVEKTIREPVPTQTSARSKTSSAKIHKSTPHKPVVKSSVAPKRQINSVRPQEKQEQEPRRTNAIPISPSGKRGYVIIASRPSAWVSVDGRATGRKTPIPPGSPLALSPGAHVITLTVEGKAFDFSVTIKEGETSKLVKMLPVTTP